jgi:hypothetical protein
MYSLGISFPNNIVHVQTSIVAHVFLKLSSPASLVNLSTKLPNPQVIKNNLEVTTP